MNKRQRVDELRCLIKESSNREKECQVYLPDIANHLALYSGKLINVRREDPTSRGNWDFAVSVETIVGPRREKKKLAVIWEVKVPQEPMFQYDNARRLVPSPQLVKAEMQLLYYVASCKGEQGFYSMMGLDNDSAVLPGGIIISCDDTLVNWGRHKEKFNATERSGITRVAMDLRYMFLYQPANIQLYTWEWVIECMEISFRQSGF